MGREFHFHRPDTCYQVYNIDICSFAFRLVIDALKAVDGDRKCYRLIGGVLVERKVKEVLPPLEKNKEMVGVKALSSRLQGKCLN